MAGSRRNIFTYDYYKKFVFRMREAYRITTFQEGRRIVDGVDEPLLILRHDIDVDLEAAVMMSSLEKDLVIHSTYFFMVSCPLYNVFSAKGAEQIKQILAAGHHFGLHFDCAVYEAISAHNLNDYVEEECHLLEHFFKKSIEAVSFHRSRSAGFKVRNVELKRLPHSYEPVFDGDKFQYHADSGGNWAKGDPLESPEFLTRKNLHLCIHPIWWTVEPKNLPHECLDDFVRRVGDRNDRYMSENFKVWADRQQ